MEAGKYYSVRDLAHVSSQQCSIVADVVKFLTDGTFIKQVGTSEPVFTRTSIILSPTQTTNILKCIATRL
jgi:hypothetical protein